MERVTNKGGALYQMKNFTTISLLLSVTFIGYAFSSAKPNEISRIPILSTVIQFNETKKFNDSNYALIEKPFENLRLAYRIQIVRYKLLLDDVSDSKSKSLKLDLAQLLDVKITPETTFEYDEKEYGIVKQIDKLISKRKLDKESLLSIEYSKNKMSVALYEYNKAIKVYNIQSHVKLKPLNSREGFENKVEF